MNSKTKTAHRISLYTLFLVSMFFSASVVGAFSLFSDPATKVDDQGAVRISATLMTKSNSNTNGTAFNLALDTHSVNLGQYDLEKLSYISFDGEEPRQGGKWQFTGGGHHFKGTLTFPYAIPSGTSEVQLILSNIDGVPKRFFSWELPLE